MIFENRFYCLSSESVTSSLSHTLTPAVSDVHFAIRRRRGIGFKSDANRSVSFFFFFSFEHAASRKPLVSVTVRVTRASIPHSPRWFHVATPGAIIRFGFP